MVNSDDREKLFLNKILVISHRFFQNFDLENLKDRFTVYNSIFIILVLYQCLISVIMCISGFYFWTNNTVEALFNFTIMINLFFSNFKMYSVIRYSKDIWNNLSIMHFNFAKHERRLRHILNLWRNRIIWITYIYTVLVFLLIISLITYPQVFSNTFLVIKNDDGSSSKYRLNIINLYLICSEETYNKYFNVFYIIELSSVIILLLTVIIFDTTSMTLSLAISCQLKIIYNAYKLVGYITPKSPNNCIDNTVKKLYTNEYHLVVYNDLKTTIINHQQVMKKYEEFLKIFQKPILLDLWVASSSIIIVWFILASIVQTKLVITTGVGLLKCSLALFISIVQLFLMCSQNDILHRKKDSIIFAVYSSNWTEMDIKCKKLVLFTMKINNAQQQKLQYTRSRIINLEIFYKTIGTYYSVISVFLNYIIKKSEF